MSLARKLVLPACLFALACGGGGTPGGNTSQSPDFSLAMTLPANIQSGGSGVATVTATRTNGHASAITLAIAANAQGITGVGTIAAGASSGSLAIQVHVGAAANTYVVTVNGTDGGLLRNAAGNLVVAAATAPIYVVSGPSGLDLSSDLYSVAPVPNGADIHIGKIQTAGGTRPMMTDLALTPDGTLFGISFNQLYRIDKTTAAATPVGSGGLPHTNGLATDAAGNLVAGADSSFISINKANGSYTLLGSFGSGFFSSGDLVYSPSGTLYGTMILDFGMPDVLVTVNPATGVATRVHPTNTTGVVSMYGLTFQGTQLLGFSADFDGKGSIWSVNTTTGAATLIRRTEFQVFGSLLKDQGGRQE